MKKSKVVNPKKRGVFLSLGAQRGNEIMMKLIKSDAARHILTVGMLTTKKPACLPLFLL